MSFRRILVAVDDSPAALLAATIAADLAGGWSAALLAVTVVSDHAIDRALREGASTRRESGADALLKHVRRIGRQHGIEAEIRRLSGRPFRQILDATESWRAELIVIGRSDRTGPASPYLGSVAAHVLEFSPCPVLVVPLGGDHVEGPA